MHSSTKYINGHSDIIGGAVITNDEEVLLSDLKFWANNLGLTGAPFDSYLHFAWSQNSVYQNG
jgi:cystathionine gamma-synthase